MIGLSSVYSFLFADTAGNHDYPKPLGVWNLSVHDTIKIFEGHTIEACPANPKIATSLETPPTIVLTGNEGTCWTCTLSQTDNNCDSYHNVTNSS